jgi:hypothetical protein
VRFSLRFEGLRRCQVLLSGHRIGLFLHAVSKLHNFFLHFRWLCIHNVACKVTLSRPWPPLAFSTFINQGLCMLLLNCSVISQQTDCGDGT